MNRYSVGIDVGGTNVKIGLVSSSGSIIARTRLSTKSFVRNKNRLINAVVEAIDDLIAEKRLKKKNISGIGIGLPGLIDPVQGIVRHLPNIPGWRNVPLKTILKKKTGLPVFVDNDANLITLAEWKLGVGKGYKNLVCVTLGTGVGGGLILDNKLFRGEGFIAGEIGHIPYLKKILEHYVGNSILQSKAAKIFKQKEMRLEDVFYLANQGNVRAVQFWREAGEHLGFVLSGVANVLNPQLIIIGGGVSNNFKYLGPAIKSAIKAKALKISSSAVKVVRAKLGDDAGILGAHILVKDEIVGR